MTQTHSETCPTIIVPEIGQPAQQCPECQVWVGRDRHDGMLRIVRHHESIARPRWEAGNQATAAVVKVVEYYEGTLDIYFPITDPASDMFGGSTVETLKCGHQHTGEMAAEKCIHRLAAREIKRRNLEQAAREATPADAERAFAMFDKFAEIG